MGLKDILDMGTWRKSGMYLPPMMRDFHDQKDLFKTIHDTVHVEKHEYVKHIDWATGHMYVIDIFLWFMARHGYTLQKSRANVTFDDIDARIEASTERRRAQSIAVLKSFMSGDD